MMKVRIRVKSVQSIWNIINRNIQGIIQYIVSKEKIWNGNKI